MLRASYSSLDDELLLQEVLPDTVAQIALQLDRVFRHGPAGAACALELLTELFQERDVSGQTRNDRDGLSAVSFFLHAQRRHDFARPRGKRVVRDARAALAIAYRPA